MLPLLHVTRGLLLHAIGNVTTTTCISLSMGFFMLRGFGAYGGRLLAMLSAAAAMTAICSSVSSDKDAKELNVGGEMAVVLITYTHHDPTVSNYNYHNNYNNDKNKSHRGTTGSRLAFKAA